MCALKLRDEAKTQAALQTEPLTLHAGDRTPAKCEWASLGRAGRLRPVIIHRPSPRLWAHASGLVLLGVLVPACGDAESNPVRPNVLLLSIDTLRADHLGFQGYDRPTSPELDAFAKAAVVFTNAQSAAPWTLPSLASIFTSSYSSTHGCWTLGSRLDEAFVTFPEVLTSAGYDSAVVASHRLCSPTFGISQGFVHNDFQLSDMEGDAEKFITSRQISDRGIRFLDQKKDAPDGKPWLLWLHYFDPHDAYMEQPEHSAKFTGSSIANIDLYDGEIAFTDEQLGRVLRALAANGQRDRTVVVLFADHGEEFMDHGRTGHGLSLHAEMLHVPLVLAIPGQAAARLDDVVRSVDLMPTLLELCHLEGPAGMAGRSLLPLIRGQESEQRLAFAEAGMRGRARLESIQQGPFKWIQDRDALRGQLFRVDEDPGELHDIASEHPERVQELQAALRELREAASQRGEAFEHAEVAIPPSAAGDLGALGYGATDSEQED